MRQALKPVEGQVCTLVEETESGRTPTKNKATWYAKGPSMPLQEVCVLCAAPLPIPRRVDARYCRRSTCRVQAFRARRQGGVPGGVSTRNPWRLPAAGSVSPRDGQGTQLAAFRLLRQTQKHAADLAAQLAQA